MIRVGKCVIYLKYLLRCSHLYKFTTSVLFGKLQTEIHSSVWNKKWNKRLVILDIKEKYIYKVCKNRLQGFIGLWDR